MKLNKKGFAISSIMYLILVMALIIVAILLGLLSSRKLVLDKQKKDIIDSMAASEIDSMTTYTFEYIDDGEEFIVPQTGIYKIELWGAQGGGTYGGKGAYTSGIIRLKRNQKLYVYVGAKGNTFNGGGNCSVSSKIGGGATDIRVISGEWNDFHSLQSRIMVAAGGGSVTDESSGAKAGVGGTINGIDGSYHSDTKITFIGYGGTQTSGGNGATDSEQTGATSGQFGIGGTAGSHNIDGHVGAGGGGGYYGGGGSSWYAGSGGGSSYISGHIGCVNITTHTPIYPNYIFSNTVMIAGNETMPTHDGASTMTGNSNDGYAKITFIASENSNPTTFSYRYTGSEQVFTATNDGYYKLETWGAQGGEGLCGGNTCGAIGGYGAYSIGIVQLSVNDKLYINVGGKGADGVVGQDSLGGYNGGGRGTWDGHPQDVSGDDEVAGGGGGATHIATVSGNLSSLSTAFSQNKVLIIAGGGGGGSWKRQGGSGGGIEGGAPGQGGIANQSTGYLFGQGANSDGVGTSNGHGGGGGGLYGGLESTATSGDIDEGGGGSGYIGNLQLLSSSSVSKHMTCYSCTTSDISSTKTTSTTDYSENPVTDKPKVGDGYAKITYIGTSLN